MAFRMKGVAGSKSQGYRYFRTGWNPSTCNNLGCIAKEYHPQHYASAFTSSLPYATTTTTTKLLTRQSIRSHSTSSSKTAINPLLEKLKTSLPGGYPSTSATLVLVFGGTMVARWWYTSYLTDTSSFPLLDPKTGAPRQDQSMVTIVMPTSKKIAPGKKEGAATKLSQASRRVPPTENTVGEEIDEESSMSIQVNNEAFGSFLRTQRQILQTKKVQAQVETQQILHDQLSAALDDCRTRGVEQFAKWYFSYTTTYRLLSIAMQSAAKHAVTFRKEHTLQEAVTQDLQIYIMEKYQAMVLRPALTDPKIHHATVKSLETVHLQIYQTAVSELEDAMQEFATKYHDQATADSIRTKSSSPLSLASDAVRIRLDWRAQLQKAQHLPVAYEKRPPEFSLALIGGGAVAGKVAGGAAIKAVSAKLAAPFVTKAVGSTLGGKVAAAGVAGAGVLAGGPLGAGLGATVGIAMDMAVNKGISLMQRSAFEEDIQQALNVTLLEWEGRILPEISRVVQEEWFGQLETMLNDDYAVTKE